MTSIPSLRQQQIMDWLQTDTTLTIEHLVDQLQVSVMTVHRDLDALANAGLVEKVHGGVTLPKPVPQAAGCAICGGLVTARTSFTVHTEAGQQLETCCPHCGFLLMEKYPDATRILVRDFLYSRVLNAAQAYYVVGGDILLCCLPSTLSFATQIDAERFQRGFGGEVMDFAATRQFLSQHA